MSKIGGSCKDGEPCEKCFECARLLANHGGVVDDDLMKKVDYKRIKEFSTDWARFDENKFLAAFLTPSVISRSFSKWWVEENNKFRKKWCPKKSRPLIGGELHIPCHNYSGPGTDLFDNVRRSAGPINDIDKCSQTHDLDYETISISPSTSESLKREFAHLADLDALQCYDRFKEEIGYKEASSGVRKKARLYGSSLPGASRIWGAYGATPTKAQQEKFPLSPRQRVRLDIFKQQVLENNILRRLEKLGKVREEIKNLEENLHSVQDSLKIFRAQESKMH